MLSLISSSLIVFLLVGIRESTSERSFTINYEENSFYMDGQPFQYVSGSVHYFRMPSQYWRDRLRKVKDAGLNAVSTYVEWSQHEPTEGKFNFDGDLDLVKFIEIAEEEGLYVILRPGPYICAERDMGGLPFWLMTKNPEVQIRTSDPSYTRYARRFLDVVMEKVAHLLYGRGGPIILVQVENEYGSYPACDSGYTTWLRDLFKAHVRDDAVLFTTDGASRSFLKCGKIPGVYATVDFGPQHNVTKMFAAQREFEPRGPLVNSEYYPGWLTHWGEPKLARQATSDVVRTLREMLRRKANVNFYMFYGGSNFGFTAGANLDAKYQSDITSYDYDAPISEAGDLTDKFQAIKEVLHAHFGTQSNVTVTTAEKGEYGEVTLKRAATLFSPRVRTSMGKFYRAQRPFTFEMLGQNFGYLLYETHIPSNSIDFSRTTLEVKKVRDLAHVYVDDSFVGSLSREQKTTRLKLKVPGDTLRLTVENLGRVNFGSSINDKKGILSPVLLDRVPLSDWNMTGFELTDVTPVLDCLDTNRHDCDNRQGFVFYAQKFQLPNGTALTGPGGNLPDSYLDVSHLTKGLVFVNGFNLGRYWSTRGPQYTMYVPGVHLRPYPEDNTLVVLDETISDDSITVKFTKTPRFN